LREKSPDHAYRIGYQLIRADGLGAWEAAIRDSTTEPLVGFLPPEMNTLTTWVNKVRNKAEDEWFKQAHHEIERIFEELGIENNTVKSRPRARDLITAMVQIRNKTKAHGAVGTNFFSVANEPYIEAIRGFLEQCPVLKWALPELP
jgi:hypothetical protein